MKSLFILLAVTFSLNAFSSVKSSIYGKDALDIVKVLNQLNVLGVPGGDSDSGFVGIKVYKFLGMECETAFSNYGGYGSKLEGGCHFDKITKKEDLTKLKSVLKASGLSPKNKVFKL